MERVGGVEPPSPPWQGGIIAAIRYPQGYCVAGSTLSMLSSLGKIPPPLGFRKPLDGVAERGPRHALQVALQKTFQFGL